MKAFAIYITLEMKYINSVIIFCNSIGVIIITIHIREISAIYILKNVCDATIHYLIFVQHLQVLS